MKASFVFAKSLWIWPESHSWDLHNGYALFRKEFSVAKLPDKAPLFLTADQSYQLSVNGQYVCRGPARGFQKSWPYDEVDIRAFLKRGRNVLAIRAHNPGFSNFQYLSQGFAGLLVAAKWKGTHLVSDQTWKCRRQTGVCRDTVPTSLQLFCQEHIGLREEDPGWMEPGFDDGDWKEPVTHPWNGMPWSALEARGLPLLEEKVIAPVSGLGTASGRCAPEYQSTRDICRLRFQEGLRHHPESVDPREITVKPSGPGRFRSFLLDFGKTVVGSILLEIDGARGGEIIDTLHVETIDRTTLTPHFEPGKHCRMAFGHRMVCREGRQSHAFYHTFGFRYMVLTTRNNAGPLRIRTNLRTTLYPLESKGSFSSSDATLENIWKTCVWTQRVCSLDAYVDTPWREQAQWWGDARVQAKNTFFYSGDLRLFRRGIDQIASQTTPEGLTYGHAPTIAHGCILPDFTLIWMITLWDYYWQSGSLEPFLAHEETLERALSCFQVDANTGLVGYDPRYWLFLDWTELFKDGYSAVFNLWFLIALEKMAELYRLAGQTRKAKAHLVRAKGLRKALGHLIRKDGLVMDGMTFRGRVIKTTSIHAQTLAILAGLQPKDDVVRIQKVLLPYLTGAGSSFTPPSSYWITYVFEVLTAAGHGTEVVKNIRKHWAPMVEHGTTWETFAPQVGNGSFSHAWSAHPLYHLMQIVGGIRQLSPGWNGILFQPVFVGEKAKTTVPTPHGAVHSSWAYEGDEIVVELRLPPGLSAQVVLPRGRTQRVRGSKKWRLPRD